MSTHQLINFAALDQEAKTKGMAMKEKTDEVKNDARGEPRNYNENCMFEERGEELLPGTALFVKNLNFKTTDEGLKNKFQSRFPIRSAAISKKRGELLLVSWFLCFCFFSFLG